MANFNSLNLFVRIGGLSQVVIEANEYHKAMLLISNDAIRLDVKFLDLDKICCRMGTWNNEFNFHSFGKLVVCENNKAYKDGNNKSVNIDFTESKLLTYKCTTDSPYISFFIDRIKYSYDYPTNKNEAIFGLNDSGHKFVQDYYNVDWGVELPKRIEIDAHNILGARCYPYFDFYRANRSHSREIIIKKTPKIKWYDYTDVESVIKYNGWICQLASLFYGDNINYTGGQIDYNNRRTVIYQILPASTLNCKNTFLYFNGLQHIYLFINAISFDKYKKYNKKFTRIIERFVQSLYLDGSTRYLALYNILELCKDIEKNGESPNNDENIPTIDEHLNSITNYLDKGYEEAISNIEDESIRNKIKRRYNAAKSALNKEPTGHEMESFIEKFLEVDKIIKHAQKNIFALRNSITHGSSINVTEDVNDILLHIGKILTLRLLGCPIQVSGILSYSDIYKE